MELKELLGSDYKDGMTAEEISAALANKTFVDPATLPASVSKEQFDKTASEAAEYKRKLAKLEAEGLSGEEKLKQLQEAAEAAQRTFTIKSNRIDVEKVLLAAGLAETEYAPFIDAIVTEDAAASVAAATGIAKMLAAQKKATDAAVRKELLDKTPTPGADQKQPGMTKENFAKLSFSEQHKFSVEHPEEYKKLYE